MSQELLYQVDEAIATITFNLLERMNALTHELEAELHRRLDEADADRAVRVIILTGAGRAFSAGYDQAQTGKSGTRHSDPKGKSHAEFIEFWHRADAGRVGYWTHMWGLGKPIIAAVNGWAMGGGFWYQLAADITIASDQAVFAQPEVRHISNTTFLFAALCGWKAANRWALTGDHFDAQEALRIGMVNEVVPHEELMDRARALAKRIALVPEPSCAAQQGDQHAGHSSCRRPFRTAARRDPRCACPRLPQRASRAPARGAAHRRPQRLSRHARRAVPARADGTALR